MEFSEKRLSLLARADEIKTGNTLDETFEKDFFSLVENVIVSMIQSEDAFFGQFLVKIERKLKFDITWPLATVPMMQGFKMYFNPYLYLECNKTEMIALFKHEIYHIMYGHHQRERELRDKYTTTSVNMALDISVNQFVNNMPPESYRLERINREFFVNLEADCAIEVYTEEIEKILKEKVKEKSDGKDDNLGSAIDISKAHEAWEESDINKDAIKQMTKKIAVSSMTDNSPKDIKALIASMTEVPQISWESELKKVLPTIRAGQRKTITRRNRRQPERLDIRGTLPNSIPEVIVAIDISASMSEPEIHKIMIEILDIAQNRTNKITVIECDNEIRRVYEMKSKKDIKKRISDNGSTRFSPVFKYLSDNKLRNQILIYFTDGVGESELTVKPITKNVIWVLTGDDELSLKQPFGKIKKIEARVEKGEGGTAAIQMIKDYQIEHGRLY